MNKIFEKWKPITDMLIPNRSKKCKESFSLYSEHHSILDSHEYNTSENDGFGNLLPLSLKILSELNIENIIENDKFIISKDRTTEHIFSIKISFDKINIDEIQLLESELKNMLIKHINKNIKYSSGIKVYRICDRIFIENKSILCLVSNFKIIGTRNEKLKRILNEC